MPNRAPEHDILFEPMTIRNKTFRNRFYQVTFGPGWGHRKIDTEIGYRSRVAEGGWALVQLGMTTPSFDSDAEPFLLDRLWSEQDKADLGRVAAGVHEHGALAGVEIGHRGAVATNDGTRWPPIGPSNIPIGSDGSGIDFPLVPRPMEEEDIFRVQQEWAAAARAAEEQGFDVITLYAGGHHLSAQFLSPRFNNRTDGYGGSLENRARFFRETVAAVRGALKNSILAVRVSADASDWGITPDVTREVMRMVDEHVDIWDVNQREWSTESGPSRVYEEGHHLEAVAALRDATTKPIAAISRFVSPDVMARAIGEGTVQFIGSARQSIADPFLPVKVSEGRYSAVRECTGSNVCIRGSHKNDVHCVQNATVGEEYRRSWHPELFTRSQKAEKSVLVVGAGPAGMECAMVLAKRGFENVHLVDAGNRLGGHLTWLTQLPGLAEYGRITDHRNIQISESKQITFVPDTKLDANDIREYGAEIVILATGSHWVTSGASSSGAATIATDESARVVDPETAAVVDSIDPATPVVVYDGDGALIGVGIAQLLRERGHDVTFVTPYLEVAPQLNLTLDGAHVRKQLREQGITTITQSRVEAVKNGVVRVVNSDGEVREVAANTVVPVLQRVADDSVYHELRSKPDALAAAGIEEVLRVGDAVSPRRLEDAIFDGHRLAREIDSDNPAMPAPHLVER